MKAKFRMMRSYQRPKAIGLCPQRLRVGAGLRTDREPFPIFDTAGSGLPRRNGAEVGGPALPPDQKSKLQGLLVSPSRTTASLRLRASSLFILVPRYFLPQRRGGAEFGAFSAWREEDTKERLHHWSNCLGPAAATSRRWPALGPFDECRAKRGGWRCGTRASHFLGSLAEQSGEKSPHSKSGLRPRKSDGRRSPRRVTNPRPRRLRLFCRSGRGVCRG
jgi:hypothetical protein